MNCDSEQVSVRQQRKANLGRAGISAPAVSTRMMGGYEIGVLPLRNADQICSRIDPLRSNNSAFSVSPITVAQEALVELSCWQAGKFGFEIDRTRALLAREMFGAEGDKLFREC